MAGQTTTVRSSDVATVERVVDLPPSAAAPVLARRAVAAFPGMGGELGYRALLLTSEAVTAAVLAVESQPCERIELRAAIFPDRVHIEVDPVGAPDESRRPPLSPYTRRIFQRAAVRWGAGEGHAAIWFDLARGPADRPPQR